MVMEMVDVVAVVTTLVLARRLGGCWAPFICCSLGTNKMGNIYGYKNIKVF
jgi:hypothetical protein